ncbi:MULTISPECIES: EAL domain-containing protein [unclassified Desulfurobacterium]|uniref:EAL domain-containing protein n=1 Tax=Desulfurobacterium sp. TC5-1 TaxID=1158318 RepID=UPI0003B71565|nr:EAL domain-containing protein [Desulfurobacterium sp. TC5-1]
MKLLEELFQIYNFTEDDFKQIQELKKFINIKEANKLCEELKKEVVDKFPEYKHLFKNRGVDSKVFSETINDFFNSIFDSKSLHISVYSITQTHRKWNIKSLDFIEVYFSFTERILSLLYNLSANHPELIDGIKKLTKLLFIIAIYFLRSSCRFTPDQTLTAADPMTGLPSRYNIQKIFPKCSNKDLTFAVVFDIRGFANINTYFGYEVGDSVIIYFATFLKETFLEEFCNGYPNIFRLQGDQFLVLMKGNQEDIKKKVEDFLNSVKEKPIKIPLEGDKHTLDIVLISVGTKVSVCNDISSLLWILENSLREFKKTKKEGFFFIDETVRKRCQRRKENVALVIKAIKENRVTFAFQKIIDLYSGDIFAFEVLARIRTKDGKLVPAGVFIDDISFYSLDGDLDKIVIEEAMQYKAKTGMKERLSINISNALLEGNVDFLERITKENNISPEEIVIELMERQNLSLISHLEEKIAYLKNLGFKIFIDDFGVDYANFHLIETLAIDGIKIDGRFVRSIDRKILDREFVEFVLSVAKQLNIAVVAEYIENERILKIIKELARDFTVFGQGYLFGKPEVKE